MSSRLSLPIWRISSQFRYLSFPYRWLVISTAGTCIIAGAALYALLNSDKVSFVYLSVLAAAVVCEIAVSGFIVARAPYAPGAFNASEPRREVPEYRTIWWDKQLHEGGQIPPVVVTGGEATFTALDDQGVNQRYELTARTTATLRLRTLYFPGWTADIGGKQVNVEASNEGNIQLVVEPGSHILTLAFKDTTPRLAGKVASASALFVLVVILFASKTHSSRRLSTPTSSKH
jgi:hypothetical protein